MRTTGVALFYTAVDGDWDAFACFVLEDGVSLEELLVCVFEIVSESPYGQCSLLLLGD